MKIVIIKVVSMGGCRRSFSFAGRVSAAPPGMEGDLLPGKCFIKRRILPNYIEYLRRQPGWVAPFRLPTFYRINACAQRLRHFTLRDIELFSDCSNICNFIASCSGSCFPSAMGLNSLFE